MDYRKNGICTASRVTDQLYCKFYVRRAGKRNDVSPCEWGQRGQECKRCETHIGS